MEWFVSQSVKDNLSRSWCWLLNLTIAVILIKYTYLVLNSLIRWLIALCSPMNYEQNMTIKEYCKDVAEINNNLVTRSSLQDFEDIVGTNKTANSCDRNQSRNQQDLYPNGWLPLIESAKVKVDHIERAMFLGLDVIVTRSNDGRVSVLDAYCTHMGVNIGVGGKVVEIKGNSCVQCPFHGWTFSMKDGQCVHIPYAKNPSREPPKQAKLRAWQCCEIDNFIYVWHHVDGSPPSWTIEPTPEIISGNWVLAGRSCHISNLHSIDALENGADIHHFEGIHNDIFLLGCNLTKLQAYTHLQRFFKHCWEPDWRPILDDEGKMTHKAIVHLDSWIKFFNFDIFHIKVRALQIGTACIRLRYHSNWYGPGVIKMNAIRLGGRRVMYIQHIYTENVLFNQIMARLVLYGEIKQLERDLIMWNHRKYLTNPVLVPEDNIIKRFRHWYAQFYKRKVIIGAE